jgi:SAM-dependent methyltransferase
MKVEIFKRQIKNFKKHWWFQARIKIIEQIILNIKFKKKINILDYGSGSGVNLNMLKKYGKVDVHEKNIFAINKLKKKNKCINHFYSNNKIKKSFYDLILIADVIEHVKHPERLLEKLRTNLKKKGFILITVPAFQFLFSKKDKYLGHYRRYDLTNLKNELKKFNIKNISYFNTFLFLPIVIVTLFNKLLKRDYIKDVETTPNKIVNILLYIIFSSEKYFLKYFNFSFGISIYALIQSD